MKVLVRSPKVDLNQVINNNNALLHLLMSESKQGKILNFLPSHPVPFPFSTTPAYFLCLPHSSNSVINAEMAKLIVDLGADINLHTSDLATPIVQALASGNSDGTKWLISLGAGIISSPFPCPSSPSLPSLRFPSHLSRNS